MRSSALSHALTTETAANDWWERLTPEEQKAYLSAHPRSRFAARVTGTSRSVRQGARDLGSRSRSAVHEWNNKSAGEKVASAGQAVAHVAKRLVHNTIHHAQHEVQTYSGAAKAVHHIARGRKWRDLDPHHKKALRSAMIHAGLTAGSLAMGDATGHAGPSVAHLIGEFAHHHAHHALLLGGGTVGLKTGRDAVRHALGDGPVHEHAAVDPRVAEEAERIASLLAGAGIPAAEWEVIFAEIERRRGLPAHQ